jgi:aspartyl-tRNA(Asn)/glutamyl-tRNA(Gln) amidotransferase subunit C
MAKLTQEDILHLAKLSRLELSEDEIVQFQQEISTILSYVEELQSVDVSKLTPTTQVTGLRSVTRPDEIRQLPYSQTELFMNTPETENGYIKVKRVLS